MRFRLGLLFVIVNVVLLLLIGGILLLWNYQSSLEFSKQEAGRYFEQSRVLAESILDHEIVQIPKELKRLRFDSDNLLLWGEQQNLQAKKDLKRSLDQQLSGGLDLVFLAVGGQTPINSGFLFFDIDKIYHQINQQKVELESGRRVVELELDGQSVVFLVASRKIVDEFSGRVLGYVMGLTQLGSQFGVLQEMKDRSGLDGVGLLYNSRLLASDFPGVFEKTYQSSRRELSEEIKEEAGYLSMNRVLHVRGAHTGVGIVMVAKNFMPEILQKRLQKQATVLLVILLSLGVSVWLLFRFLAQRPIDRLADYTSRLVGNGNETLLLSTGIYEYDLIADHFRGLIDSLKKSEELHKTLFENTGASTFLFNKTREVEHINAKGAEMIGLPQADMIGRKWDEFVHPEDLPKMLDFNKKRFHAPQSAPSEYEFRLRPFYGEVVVCKMVVALIPDEERGIATFFSIDAEKKLQRQLEEMNEKLELKVHQRTQELSRSNARLDEAQKIAHIGSFEWNLENDLGEWSNEMYRLLGYKPQEMPASLNRFASHIQEQERNRFMDDLRRCQQGVVLERDIRISLADEEEKVLHMIAACLEDSDGHSKIVGTMQDVSQIRLMENERRNNEQLLIQQSRLAAMGEMIGAIAHQWRQPLAAIGGILINIQDGIEYGDVEKEEFTRYINSAEELLKYMSGTIDDFRGFFKPSHQKEHFDVVVSVCKAAHMVGGLLKNHHISLCVTKHPGTDKAQIIGDYVHPPKEPGMTSEGYPNELQQVFINLLTNSKDAILENGEENGKIKAGIFVEGHYVVIEVKDNGGGAKDDVLQKVFDPYFTTKEEGKGTGIGLYMAKMIVEKNMDGMIDATNEGGGLKVTVRLPLKGEGDKGGIREK